MKHDVKDQALGKPNGKGEFLEDVKMKQEDVTAVTNQRLMVRRGWARAGAWDDPRRARSRIFPY